MRSTPTAFSWAWITEASCWLKLSAWMIISNWKRTPFLARMPSDPAFQPASPSMVLALLTSSLLNCSTSLVYDLSAVVMGP